VADEHAPVARRATSKAPIKYKRHLRNYILDKGLQLRYIGLVSVLSAAICALLGWLIFTQRTQASRTIIHSLETADFLGAEQKAEIVQHLTRSDFSVVLRMGLVCAGLIVVLSMFLVVLTHKAAGPLHMIGAMFDRLAAGQLPLVHRLRHGDEFQLFHKKFKDMCNALRVRAEDDIRLSETLVAACRRANVDESGDLGHALDELSKLAKEKQAALE
jgi:methyl-accepting chemotaxis protein